SGNRRLSHQMGEGCLVTVDTHDHSVSHRLSVYDPSRPVSTRACHLWHPRHVVLQIRTHDPQPLDWCSGEYVYRVQNHPMDLPDYCRSPSYRPSAGCTNLQVCGRVPDF